MYITKKEFNGRNNYSTTCKDKDKNLVYFMDLQFPRDNEPQGTDIKITDFFMSCYQSKDGIKPKMIITKYNENTQDGQAPRQITPQEVEQMSSKLSDDAFSDFGNSIELNEVDIDPDIAF